jgi:hypothetical protein
MQVQAQAHVETSIAEQFPSRPELVQEVAALALEAMTQTAAERNRHLVEAPRLSDIRDTKLGLVEVTFVADTEAD